MGKNHKARLTIPSIRLLLIVLTVATLTASLVTRTFRIQVLPRVTAQSNSPHALRQHLDRGASSWAPPTLHFAPLLVSEFASRVPTVWLRLPSLRLDEKLYNRPPPSR